jgi:hypothetical protein
MKIEVNPLELFRRHAPTGAPAVVHAAVPVAAVPAPPQPAPQPVPAKAEESHMASFTSVLSDIGSALKKFFTAAVPVATAAEPFVAAVFPGIAPLFNAVVAEVGKAEAAAAAAGAQNGTGTQKLAMVLASVESSFNAYAAQNGFVAPSADQIESAVNAAVAFMNALPATKATS